MDTNPIFDEIASRGKPSYIGSGLALYDDVRLLSLGVHPLFLSDATMLIFVQRGYMHIEVDGEGMRVNSRHCIFFRPGHILAHTSYSDGFAGIAMIMSIRFGHQMLTVTGNIWRYIAHIDSKEAIELSEPTLQLMRHYYALLKAEVVRPNNIYYSEVVTSIVRAMLCSLVNDVRQYSHFLPEIRSDESQAPFSGSPQMLSLFNRFMEILTTEPRPSRSLSHYASRLCVSPKYLSAVCKCVSKRTAHQWVTEAIVNGIDHYLRYSDKSIKEIAVIYGFPSLSFFSKYVKRHLGVSPNKYREVRKFSSSAP